MKSYTIQFGTSGPCTGYSGLSPSMLIFYNLATGLTVAPPSITETPVGWGMYSFSYGTTQPMWFLADACTTSPGTNGRYVTGFLDPSDRADEYGNTLVAIGTSLSAQGNSSIALGTSIYALEQNLGSTLVGLGTSFLALGSSLTALGTSGVALGTTSVALGTTNVAIGTSLTALGVTILANTGAAATLSVVIGSTASVIGGVSAWPGDLFGYMKRVDALLEGQSQFVKGSGSMTMFDLAGLTALSTRTVTNNASLVVKQ